MIKTIWFGVGMYNISENTKLLQHGMKFIQEIVPNQLESICISNLGKIENIADTITKQV